MLNCIIIDDEQINVDKLKAYIARVDTLTLLFDTTDPVEGAVYIAANNFDVAFLDIQMDDMDGMALAALIPDKKKIIFTTASEKYSLEAFEVGVLDYMHKPFGFDRFLKAVQKATEYQQSQKASTAPPVKVSGDIFLKGDSKSKMIRLRLDDILYIEGQGNYAMFHTKNDRIMSLITLKELEERLPYPQFIRVQKSYMVAYDAILGVEGNEVVIKGEKKNINIPIGTAYREPFFALIQKG